MRSFISGIEFVPDNVAMSAEEVLRDVSKFFSNHLRKRRIKRITVEFDEFNPKEEDELIPVIDGDEGA